MAFTAGQTMWASIVMFFMSLFVSMLLIITGGSILDLVHNSFTSAGIFDLTGVWGSTNLYDLVTTIFYGGCILLPVLCLGLMIWAIYNKYVLDKEEEMMYAMPPGGNI